MGRIDPALAAPPSHSYAPSALLAALLLGANLLAPAPACAATLDQDFGTANAAFVRGDFEAARTAYEDLLRHDLRAAALHYNLANTLVRLGRLGEAIGHYKQASRQDPDPALASDIAANLRLVRDRLSERARRKHRILHIFDESPELEVAVARAAPHALLGVVALGAAALALLLLAWSIWRPTTRAAWRGPGIAIALILHVVSSAWLWQAQSVAATVAHGVIVHEDAPLTPCAGVGETVDLPEGLEIRILQQRPDGRVRIRLPNGRIGCVAPSSVYRSGA